MLHNLFTTATTQSRLAYTYRVYHHVSDLGLVDIDLESSSAGGPLLWLATAQAGWRNIQNLSQPNPGPRHDGAPCIFGYSDTLWTRKKIHCKYRVDQHVSDLGWVDLDFGCCATLLGQ